ncbi:hypothetical protein ACJJIC_15090 [Microbulbifer sp. ANSA002]|uniref:hypothetical protein n=1 Tax=unclassified Microbulbifer TaxID=2619833 RepID=UPI004040EEFF
MRGFLYKIPFYISLILSACIAIFCGISIDKMYDASYGIFVMPIVFIVSHFLINGVVLNGLVFRKVIERNTLVFEYDESQGRISCPGEAPRVIPWEEVTKIEIVTTDRGPWEEDVWWLFYLNESESPIDMAQGTKNHEKIFEVLEGYFTDVNMNEISRAMGSTVNAKFNVWAKSS